MYTREMPGNLSAFSVTAYIFQIPFKESAKEYTEEED
jgi:hypothetical protein